ncbi:hypothetical protein B0H16DRAFT_1459433 [Mycena metata]|uniref:Uncharacterized protein n=1 Tax=Mycena metata TaxID=1033252 RepID=A0AAD7NBP0_9AGAR|nr:hypothetical protein B0H16DRAFT_1459433 [Mycena metata]
MATARVFTAEPIFDAADIDAAELGGAVALKALPDVDAENEDGTWRTPWPPQTQDSSIELRRRRSSTSVSKERADKRRGKRSRGMTHTTISPPRPHPARGCQQAGRHAASLKDGSCAELVGVPKPPLPLALLGLPAAVPVPLEYRKSNALALASFVLVLWARRRRERGRERGREARTGNRTDAEEVMASEIHTNINLGTAGRSADRCSTFTHFNIEHINWDGSLASTSRFMSESWKNGRILANPRLCDEGGSWKERASKTWIASKVFGDLRRRLHLVFLGTCTQLSADDRGTQCLGFDSRRRVRDDGSFCFLLSVSAFRYRSQEDVTES